MDLTQLRVHLSESLFSGIGFIGGSRNFDQLVKSLEFFVTLMKKTGSSDSGGVLLIGR